MPLLLTAGVLVLFGAAATLVDRPVAMWARTLAPSWRLLAEVVTAFGSSGYMFAAAGLVFLGSAAVAGGPSTPALQERARQAATYAVLLIVTLALSGLVAQAVKHLVGRVRPRFSATLDTGSFHPFDFHNANASFPSGHTTSAFAAATLLGLGHPKARPLLFAWAVSIGVSRVALGEHYPSDVIAGAGLGMAVAMAVVRSRWMPGARDWLLRRTLLAMGQGRLEPSAFRALAHGRWSLPLLVGACFVLGSPPADLFGSTSAEHAKDGFAILTALGGLTLRGAAISASAPGPVSFQATPAVWRAPFRLGSVMVVFGIVLMHGALLTIALGSAAALAVFGPFSSELERSSGPAARLPRFDLGRILTGDYPVIGTTIVTLALAEFWEELTEPNLASRLTYLEGLAGIMIAGCLAMALCARVGRTARRTAGA